MIFVYQSSRGMTEELITTYATMRKLENVSVVDIDRVEVTSLIPDTYVVIGYDAYATLSKLAHMGFRKVPDWEHILRLDIIRLSCGAEFIVSTPIPDQVWQKVDNYLMGKFKPMPPALTTNEILVDALSIKSRLESIINNYEAGTLIGFDYETTGLYDSSHEDNKNFYATGVSISIGTQSWFLDFRFMTDEEKEEVMDVFRQFCKKFQDNIYAFNAQFEYMTTAFECGEVFEFSDLRHFWIQDGYHMDFQSFKYIARYYLNVPDWDSDFDIMTDVIHQFYELIDSYPPEHWEKFQAWCRTKPVGRQLTLADIDLTDEPIKIRKTELYPSEVLTKFNAILMLFNGKDWDEFAFLINSPIWNVAGFGVIPSRFLGHYCNYDAYYTQACVNVCKGKYSQLCDDVYRDNSKFGMTINSTGVYKDQEAYDDYWKVINQKLAHEAWVLGIHGMRRKLARPPKLKSHIIKGLPTYQTLIPATIVSSKRYSYPSEVSQYVLTDVQNLVHLKSVDPIHEMWDWLVDYTNPYLVVFGLVARIHDWEESSGKKFDADSSLPRWMDAEYVYWNIPKLLKKWKRNQDQVFGLIISKKWEELCEVSGDAHQIIEQLGTAVVEMLLDHNFNKVIDAHKEWYELKKVIAPAKYYDKSGKEVEPEYVNELVLPDNIPGFIVDVLAKGYTLSNLYYYCKNSLIMDTLYNPLYERNYDENIANELFNNYTPIDKQYNTLKDEIDDWLFWKSDEINEGLTSKISVLRGLAKVMLRVINETLGDIDEESFNALGDKLITKAELKALEEIPEFQSFTGHSDLPDILHYKGKEITTYDFQVTVLRELLGLTGPVSYDAYMDDYLLTYSKQVKFSVIVHQYADIYNKYIRQTELDTSKSWVDQYLQEYNEFDLSKLYVIDDKDLAQSEWLTKIKILLANEFKLKVIVASQAQQDLESIYKHADILSEWIPRFQFMETYDAQALQVLVYEAKQSDGKFKVAKSDYAESPTSEVETELRSAYQELLDKSLSLVLNVCGLSNQPNDVAAQFLSIAYPESIHAISSELKQFYESKLSITIDSYDKLIEVCIDMLTDVDKSWMVNERQYMTDWLIKHMYHVSYLSDHYGDEWTDEFIKYLDSNDVDPDHPLYAYKIFFMQRMFKKDNKALTYLTGMLKDYDTYYDEIDEFTMIGKRWSNNPKSARWCKMMVPWGCNVLASKRWNGPLQTLAKGAEYRRICGTPTNKFLTYYDISQAEPRTSAYTSGDKNMIYYFENNIDLYISCGELFIGRKALDWEERMYLRNLFKSILLGISNIVLSISNNRV